MEKPWGQYHRDRMTRVRYTLNLRQIDTVSDWEASNRGVFACAEAELDRQSRGSDVMCALSITEMLGHYKRGTPMRIWPAQQTVDIYQAIEDYLNAWIFELETQLINREVPMDDLLRLDEMAEHFYDHALCEMPEREKNRQKPTTALASALEGTRRGVPVAPQPGAPGPVVRYKPRSMQLRMLNPKANLRGTDAY